MLSEEQIAARLRTAFKRETPPVPPPAQLELMVGQAHAAESEPAAHLAGIGTTSPPILQPEHPAGRQAAPRRHAPSPGIDTLEPVHRSILAVDIEGFARHERDDRVRVELRRTLHQLLNKALTHADIPPTQRLAIDLGDGMLLLIGAEVSKARLLRLLIPHLVSGLTAYNLRRPPAGRMRLRVVLHAGEVVPDAYGVAGEALNLAFRLLDSDAARRALARTTAPLVLVTSRTIYEGVVKHRYHDLDPAGFQPVAVRMKETSTPVWVYDPAASPAGSSPGSVGAARTGLVVTDHDRTHRGRDDTDEELLRTADVARMLQVSMRTVLAWAQAGKLPSVLTPGGHRRYPRWVVEQFGIPRASGRVGLRDD